MPPPLAIALLFIFLIALGIMGGVIFEINEMVSRLKLRPAFEQPERERDRLYGTDIRWSSTGCAYRADMAGGSMYYSPHVVPDETTPDPSDGKLLCDPAKARP